MAAKPIEPGTIVGSTTVLAHLGSNTHGQAMFSVSCNVCGNIEIVAGYKLRQGKTKQCSMCKLKKTAKEKNNVE